MENSWYIYDKGIHHYFCKCGEHDKIETKDEAKEQFHPDNVCLKCKNEHYLDLNSLLFQNKIRFWSDVKWSYEKIINDKEMIINATLKFPKFIFNSKDIQIQKLPLLTLKATKNQSLQKFHSHSILLNKLISTDQGFKLIEEVMSIEMKNKLKYFIVNNPPHSLSWLDLKNESIDMLLFFFEHTNLKSRDFFEWQNKKSFLKILKKEKIQHHEEALNYILNFRKEKSLRKAQFSSYQASMERGEYNFLADYIFSRSIKEKNNLLRALSMPIEIKNRLFDSVNIQNLFYFIKFLKKHYKERDIVTLWLNVTDEMLRTFVIKDIVNLFNSENSIEKFSLNFSNTALNLKIIYEAIIIEYNKNRVTHQIRKRSFIHKKSSIASQVVLFDIEYRLPSTQIEQSVWGRILSNRIFSHVYQIPKRKTVIFGLFKDNVLTYALETVDNKIIQLSGQYNHQVSKKEKEKIDQWFKNVYLKNLIS